MARRMGRGKCRQLTYSINLSFPWISLVCHSVYGEKWRCLNFSRKWNTDCSELKRGKPRMSSRSIWQLPVVEMRGSFSFLSLTSLLTLFWNWLQQFLSPGISIGLQISLISTTFLLQLLLHILLLFSTSLNIYWCLKFLLPWSWSGSLVD